MIEKTQNLIQRNAVTIKIVAIFILTLLLLIPVEMIRSLKTERQVRQNETLQDVSSKWGGEQTVTGPILTVPYTHYDLNEKDEPINVQRDHYYVLPEKLNIQTELIPEIRKRGIFKVVVYKSIMRLSGNFPAPQALLEGPQKVLNWEEVNVSIGISDIKGISNEIAFNWNDQQLMSSPGVKTEGLLDSGFSVETPLNETGKDIQNSFSIKIELNGSRNIRFVPVGKETNVEMTSSWPDPGFSGAFIPVDHQINESGFTATWKVLDYNRNYPQYWTQRKVNFDESAFGTDLILPVNNYQVVERSTKYAILFFVFAFMVFFFIENIRKQRVHPLQYALVGFGLVLFYLMLLSLSEHLSFGISYLLASAGIIVLITGYSRAIFQNSKSAGTMGVFLTLVYGILFILLQMQDFVLLLGSLILFAALAAAMYMSLKIDLGGKNKTEEVS